MPRSTTEQSRLYLTAEFRAAEELPCAILAKTTAALFATELKRFPPIEDVVAALDRIASRNFAA